MTDLPLPCKNAVLVSNNGRECQSLSSANDRSSSASAMHASVSDACLTVTVVYGLAGCPIGLSASTLVQLPLLLRKLRVQLAAQIALHCLFNNINGIKGRFCTKGTFWPSGHKQPDTDHDTRACGSPCSAMYVTLAAP